MELSIYMQDRGLKSISKTIENFGEKQFEDWAPGENDQKFINFLMAHIKAGDKHAILLGGMSNYLYYLDKFNGDKQKAIRKFEEDTKEVQQSSDKQDKDHYQRMGGYVQMFNMFMSAPKAYMRQPIIAYRELYRKFKAGDKNVGKGSVWQNARTILVYQHIMPMVFQWATMGFPITDWDDEDKEDLARAAIIGNLNALFIFGDAISMIGDWALGKPWWKETTKLPWFNLLSDFLYKAKKAETTKDPEKAAEYRRQAIYALIPFVPGVGASIKGLPAKTIDRMVDNINKVIQDGEFNKETLLRIFNYSDYVIGGEPKKETNKPKLRNSEIKKYLPELYDQTESFKDPDFEAQMKEFKKEQEAMRQELLEEMFAD